VTATINWCWKAGNAAIDSKTIHSQLREMIPDYMLPSKYHQMDSIPLNANGKIDRQLLKEQLI